MLNKNAITLIPLLAASLLLSACDNNDDSMEMGKARYQIDITNLSNNQPFSPPALVSHAPDYQPWMIGSPASMGLEKLAEGGDNSEFVMQAQSHSEVGMIVSGSELILPGATASFTLQTSRSHDTMLSLATMLVNSNDAFTGLNSSDIGMLAKGMPHTLYSSVYDAGTEQNSETAASIPGPAGGGEGFNAEREAANQVTMHAGVVSMDDGVVSYLLSLFRYLFAMSFAA